MENIFKKLEETVDKYEIDKAQAEKDFHTFAESYWENPDSLLPTIIFGHLYVEQCINALIKKAFKDSSKILNYRFANKIDLLEAAGIIKPSMIERIRALNQVRNKIAHNLDFNLTKEFALLFTTDPKDIKLFNKSKSGFMIGEISYQIGYLHAVTSGQRTMLSQSIGTEDLPLIKNILQKNK